MYNFVPEGGLIALDGAFSPFLNTQLVGLTKNKYKGIAVVLDTNDVYTDKKKHFGKLFFLVQVMSPLEKVLLKKQHIPKGWAKLKVHE